MAKDCSIKGAAKLRREKRASDAPALSTVGAPAPSEGTMALFDEHIDGKREMDEIPKLTIELYSVAGANAWPPPRAGAVGRQGSGTAVCRAGDGRT
jgi:hypothetical protein